MHDLGCWKGVLLDSIGLSYWRRKGISEWRQLFGCAARITAHNVHTAGMIHFGENIFVHFSLQQNRNFVQNYFWFLCRRCDFLLVPLIIKVLFIKSNVLNFQINREKFKKQKCDGPEPCGLMCGPSQEPLENRGPPNPGYDFIFTVNYVLCVIIRDFVFVFLIVWVHFSKLFLFYSFFKLLVLINLFCSSCCMQVLARRIVSMTLWNCKSKLLTSSINLSYSSSF